MDKSGLGNLTVMFNTRFVIHHVISLRILKKHKISFMKDMVTVVTRYRMSVVAISFVTLFSLCLVFGSIFQHGAYARGQIWSQTDDNLEKICNSNPTFFSFCYKDSSTFQSDPFDTFTDEEQKVKKLDTFTDEEQKVKKLDTFTDEEQKVKKPQKFKK
jgi:hypothetical protein